MNVFEQSPVLIRFHSLCWKPNMSLGTFCFLDLKMIFFLSSCLTFTCALVHLQPPWLSSYESLNQRNRVEKNNIQAKPFINNRGWEQRANAPNTQQKAALGTVGSSKWRCWNIKNFTAQKYCNMLSVNCNNTAMFTFPASLWGFIPKWWKSQKV